MTPSETVELLAFLTEAYPSFRSADPRARVAVWSDLLAESDFAAITAGARHWAKTEKFAPSAADLIRAAADETDGDVPTWMECKAAIEASSHGRGLPPDAHPVMRATAAICGGPISLAAMSPYDAERAVRSAHATGVARHQRSMSVGHRRAIEESSDDGDRQAIEAATSTMFAKP